jgi:regulatory protein SWI5
MLHNPPSTGGDLAARQRQHRRQNSTPTAWEAVNIAPLPNFSNQRPARVSHRRGLSLDQRPRLLPQTRLAPTMRESFAMVGNSATTNTDSPPEQQHIQREAQQHRFVNPGPSQQQQEQQLHNFLSQQQHQQQHQQQQQQQPHRQNRHQRHESDSFLLTPHGTPGNQHFEDFLDSAQGHMGTNMIHPAYYMESMDAMMKKNQANFATNNSLADPLGFNFFPAESTLSPTNLNFVFPKADPAGSGAAWMSEPEMMSSESRPVSRRISNGILDKMAKFEPLLPDQTQRMVTPPAQNNPGKSPGLNMTTDQMVNTNLVASQMAFPKHH